MCGIFGAVGLFDQSTFSEAVNIVAHRGPDDSGIFFDKNIGLGHRRLSIQDTSDAAHQPMSTSDNRYTIIFNGEIYNHREIRAKLKGEHHFRSTGDTETLLYAWAEMGEKVLRMLNGIFAFALYDRVEDAVVLARDPFGVKPLYYYSDAEKFLFGSELKSINQFSIDRTIDPRAIMDYLRFLYAPFERTPFLKVRKLQPGYTLKINLSGHQKIKIKQYFEIPFNGRYEYKNERQALEVLDDKLHMGVKRQLISDVPLGFFLSGGLDSSAVLAMAADELQDGKINAFSIDTSSYGQFDGFADDLVYARKVADQYNVNLNVVPANHQILDAFDTMIWHLDEPQADPAPLHVRNIARMASDMGIKVLLGGSAGDDVFSGYRRHQAIRLETWLKYVPGFFKHRLNKMGKKMDRNVAWRRRFTKITDQLEYDTSMRLFNYFTWLGSENTFQLFNKHVVSELDDYEQSEVFMQKLENIPKESNWLNRMLYWEMKSFMVDHNLNYTDKMSMAEGIETRVPFLDLDLVMFSARLHPDLKMKGRTTKYLLKKLMEKYLPSDVIYRPKTGFGAPVRQWIRHDMEPLIHDYLSHDTLKRQDIFNPEQVGELLKNNREGKIDAAYTIWSLLAVSSWIHQFCEKKH